MAFARLSTLVSLVLGAAQLANAAATRRVTCPDGNITANAACCALFPVVENLQTNLFDGAECGEEAHSALRLVFHDSIGFSIHGGKGGGADGSILIFNATELAFHANIGVDDITARQFPVFQTTGLSAGDFVALAGAVGTANCPGAPRLEFLFGRPPPLAPAPDLTIPEPTDNVTAILTRFADAGFTAEEVVALLSSHTIAAADEVDPTIPGTPFDSTVGTFDTQVFLEVLLKGSLFPGNGSQPGEVLSPLPGEMRLQSDFVVSRDPRTACLWQAMVNDQTRMQTQFKAAMAKLQVTGQDTRKLIDCSDVIPIPAAFKGPIEFPATFSKSELQQACNAPFPTLKTAAGPIISVAPVFVIFFLSFCSFGHRLIAILVAALLVLSSPREHYSAQKLLPKVFYLISADSNLRLAQGQRRETDMPPGTPFNGLIPPYPIRVDEFSSPSSGSLSPIPALYLLSHTHSDHIVGLSAKSFSSKVICSHDAKQMLLRHEVYKERALVDSNIRENARLGRTFEHLKICPTVVEGRIGYQGSRDLLYPLPLNTPTDFELSNNEIVTITLLDANHCPGAVMFLVEGSHGAVLHTGDLRAEPWFLDNLSRNPILQPYLAPWTSVPSLDDKCNDSSSSVFKNLEAIYLDTACVWSPTEVPTKAKATEGLISIMSHLPEDTTFFINSWTWGYEDVLKDIHVDRYKHDIYARLSDRFMKSILTLDAAATRFHACERFDRCEYCADPCTSGSSQAKKVVYINPVSIGVVKWEQYLQEVQSLLRQGGEVTCLLVPLSRHSPLPELRKFVSLFRPKRVVPNTLDPSLCGLDWRCIDGMFANCVSPSHFASFTVSDLEAEMEDEVELTECEPDAALKNLLGNGAEELAERWGVGGNIKRKLETMLSECQPKDADRKLLRKLLGLPSEVQPAKSMTTWQKMQDKGRVKVSKGKLVIEREETDEETEDEWAAEERGKVADALFGNGRWAGYEESSDVEVHGEEGKMHEGQRKEMTVTLSTPRSHRRPLKSQREEGGAMEECQDAVSFSPAVNERKVDPFDFDPLTPPTTARDIRPALDRSAHSAPRVASPSRSSGMPPSLSGRSRKRRAPAEESAPIIDLNNLPSDEWSSQEDRTDHESIIKRRRLVEEWLDLVDEHSATSVPAKFSHRGQENRTLSSLAHRIPENRHSQRSSFSRGNVSRPQASPIVQSTLPRSHPSTQAPIALDSIVPAPTEPGPLEDPVIKKAGTHALRQDMVAVRENLRAARPDFAQDSENILVSDSGNGHSHKNGAKLQRSRQSVKNDTRSARQITKSTRTKTSTVPQPLVCSVSFTTVYSSSDERGFDADRSRLLEEQIRTDVAEGRTPRVPRLECLGIL
ncbi:hypothetical protein EW146_g2607 [Bondarzewia mesenterica]|uniref:Peroxidase n=1 Tax=Bondarzewia mesenterica TaxID=1095465 RepID=A0A4S4M1Z7_9AGAM|nr:hypothetical protein EW146_g2607 [Bondarzewia mesenterica]